jgi:seryl-tRNA(Sec) selenium transferase
MLAKQPLEEASHNATVTGNQINIAIDALEADIEAWKNSDRSDTTLYNTLQKTVENLTGVIDEYELEVTEVELLERINDGELLN